MLNRTDNLVNHLQQMAMERERERERKDTNELTIMLSSPIEPETAVDNFVPELESSTTSLSTLNIRAFAQFGA